jgi:hypothetical protein
VTPPKFAARIKNDRVLCGRPGGCLGHLGDVVGIMDPPSPGRRAEINQALGIDTDPEEQPSWAVLALSGYRQAPDGTWALSRHARQARGRPPTFRRRGKQTTAFDVFDPWNPAAGYARRPMLTSAMSVTAATVVCPRCGAVNEVRQPVENSA